MKLYRKMPHEEWEAVEPVDFLYDESSGVIVVPVAGRWVPWCDEHDALGLPCEEPGEELCAGGAVLRWVRAPVQPCRWHPQGAFVPDDEGGTT